jgi:hypothetical protein
VAHGITAHGDRDDGRAPILNAQTDGNFRESPLKRGLSNPQHGSLSDQPGRRGPSDCAASQRKPSVYCSHVRVLRLRSKSSGLYLDRILRLLALLPIELGKHVFRHHSLHTAPASHKHASPIASAQGRNRAFQTVSPVITVPELLPRRLVSNPVFEAGRVFSRIVPQSCPVVAHVHLTTPGCVVAERVQRRVVSVTHDELRERGN